ncbi:MAG: copper transporter [Gaiellaceae bacterium]
MFDFRYHVASLAAVFLALIIGILVGVAISDPGLADRALLERRELEIARLHEELDSASEGSKQQDAAVQFVEEAYDAVMKERLSGREIAVVFVGSVDDGLNSEVETALADAGAAVLRLRALTVPIREDALQASLRSQAALAGYVGDDHLSDLGRDLGRELVDGGETPLWNALGDELLEERRGRSQQEANAVVVVRSARPQGAGTARFLRGFYAGLRGSVPVVGVEASTAERSAIPVYRRAEFSSVDSIDTRVGKVALAVLLAGGARGQYGLKEQTADAPIPPIEPVEPNRDAGG